MRDISRVGVLGCGQMGSGIAQAAAVAGFATVARDVETGLLARGERTIQRSLDKLVEKGKLGAADRDAALGRLTFTVHLEDLAHSDLVIEAVTESLELKTELWRALDPLCPPHTLFASNTSSLSIGAMAAATGRPDRFVGLHFFNPVPLMPLVEVVRAIGTSRETFEAAETFARRLGKEPIAAQDRPGFVVNRLLVPYLLDAARARESGLASSPDLDRGMQLGCGHPMGPLTLMDFIGLDTVVRIADIMADEFREARFAPPPLLRRMVTAGLHGRKSGRGFYDYSTNPPTPVDLGL
ncbi:MAG TPA: 3-hydroxybutyryl-CoA dehydrogenase [Gemmatimonadales bacterium]